MCLFAPEIRHFTAQPSQTFVLSLAHVTDKDWMEAFPAASGVLTLFAPVASPLCLCSELLWGSSSVYQGAGTGVTGATQHIWGVYWKAIGLSRRCWRGVLRGLTRLLPFPLHTPPSIRIYKQVCVFMCVCGCVRGGQVVDLIDWEWWKWREAWLMSWNSRKAHWPLGGFYASCRSLFQTVCHPKV